MPVLVGVVEVLLGVLDLTHPSTLLYFPISHFGPVWVGVSERNGEEDDGEMVGPGSGHREQCNTAGDWRCL